MSEKTSKRQGYLQNRIASALYILPAYNNASIFIKKLHINKLKVLGIFIKKLQINKLATFINAYI